MDFYDPDHSYDEHRYILIGESAQGRLLFVSYMGVLGTMERKVRLSFRHIPSQVSARHMEAVMDQA